MATPPPPNEAQARALAAIEASTSSCIIGIDEVGTGSWAGPVMVGAAVLPRGWSHPLVQDSKALKHKSRQAALKELQGVMLCSVVLDMPNTLVDQHGKEQVRQWLTESCALYCLRRYPDALVVQDGDVPVIVDDCVQNMVWLSKADVYVPAVSAASILAKETRDAFMREQAKIYPGYAFESNMGYHSRDHVDGLVTQGPCPIHRMSYKPVRAIANERVAHQQMLLDFGHGDPGRT